MKQLTILELATKLNVTIPDFISDYSNKIEAIELDDLVDLESKLDDIREYIHEYADNSVPIYFHQIDSEYDDISSDYSIDDVISEGLMESMRSEADIYKAKQMAIFMCYEAEISRELSEFNDELNKVLDAMNGEQKEELFI